MVTFRVESSSRSDALALAHELARHRYYRWYLIEPDGRHWHVCIPVEQPSRNLPEALRQTIRTWLRERHLKNAVIHTGTNDLHHREQTDDRTVLRGELAEEADEPLAHKQRPFFADQHATNGRIVLRIGGECDAATLERLNETLQAAIENQPQEVIVDLAEATFVDSLTLGSLMAAANHVRANGGTFQVVGATASEVRRAFQITGLDEYLLKPRG